MLVVMFCGQLGNEPLVGMQIASIYSGFANFHMSAVLNAACNKIGQYHEILTDEKNEFTDETKNAAVRNIKIYTKLLIAGCHDFNLGLWSCVINSKTVGRAFN